MRGQELLDQLNLVDAAYVEEADRMPEKTGKRRIWGAAAACLCAAAAMAMVILPYTKRNTSLEEIPGREESRPNSPFAAVHNQIEVMEDTSDTYKSLEELLGYLSENDYHDGKRDGSVSISAPGPEGRESVNAGSPVWEGRKTVSLGGYTYQSGSGGIGIYQSGSLLGQFGTGDYELFLSGDRLIAVSTYVDNDREIDLEYRVYVEIYDMASPEEPVLLECFTQSGSKTACYMAGGQLYLMTSDGVCACGWSRLEDLSGYVPQLYHGDGRIEWTEEDIRILGEPVSVRYIAVTAIDIASAAVSGKRAYYGNIDDVFYGDGWFAVSTASRAEDAYILPEVYTFDAPSMAFAGKVDMAAVCGTEKTGRLTDSVYPDGEYPYVVSVFREGADVIVIGGCRIVASSSYPREKMIAVVYDLNRGEADKEELELPERTFTVDDILWEEGRAVISVGSGQENNGEWNEYARIVFAEFGGGGVEIITSDIICDRVAGIDRMYWMGNPFGSLKPFISLGGGIYLRYNGIPDGFDIYDFTDSRAPVCLRRTEGDIPEGYRLDFENWVYDENTIGVRMIIPNHGNYVDTESVWCVFSVKLLEEPEVEKIGEYGMEGVDVRVNWQ